MTVLINPYELIAQAASIFEDLIDKFGPDWEIILGKDFADEVRDFMVGADFWEDEEELKEEESDNEEDDEFDNFSYG